MKDRVLKVLLIISSLPLIGVFIWAIYNAIFGTSFMGTEIYGFDAFVLTIIASFFMHVPVLAICIAYQLFYLIRYIVKNNKIDIEIKSSSFDGERIVEIAASRGGIPTGVGSTNRFGVE